MLTSWVCFMGQCIRCLGSATIDLMLSSLPQFLGTMHREGYQNGGSVIIYTGTLVTQFFTHVKAIPHNHCYISTLLKLKDEHKPAERSGQCQIWKMILNIHFNCIKKLKAFLCSERQKSCVWSEQTVNSPFNRSKQKIFQVTTKELTL